MSTVPVSGVTGLPSSLSGGLGTLSRPYPRHALSGYSLAIHYWRSALAWLIWHIARGEGRR